MLVLSRMPVFLEPHRADVRQRRVQPGPVVPEYPVDDLVFCLTPRDEALSVQPLHLQRPEQRLAAGVVPAVAAPAHRGRDAVLGQHASEVLAGVLAAPVAVEDQTRALARMALEPGHTQRIDDDVPRHVRAQRPAHHLAAEQVDHHGQEQPAFVGGDVGDVSRSALTQLNSVCSTTPSVLAAAAMLCPPCTSRTASCLNSSV